MIHDWKRKHTKQQQTFYKCSPTTLGPKPGSIVKFSVPFRTSSGLESYRFLEESNSRGQALQWRRHLPLLLLFYFSATKKVPGIPVLIFFGLEYLEGMTISDSINCDGIISINGIFSWCVHGVIMIKFSGFTHPFCKFSHQRKSIPKVLDTRAELWLW